MKPVPQRGDIANDDLLENFRVFRERVKSGLRRVMEIKSKEPHYASLLIIVTACEILSVLRYGKKAKSRVFVAELIGRHDGVTKAMAEDLWAALRNGVVHHFSSKYVAVSPGGPRIRISLNWGRGLPHLHLLRCPDRFNVNLPDLQDDLERILNAHRDYWQALPPNQRQYPEWWQTERVHRASADPRRGWSALLATTPERG